MTSEEAQKPDPPWALHWDLRQARREQDVPALVAGLSDPIEGVTAARFLADLNATEAIPAIAPLLTDIDRKRRSAAMASLARLGATEFLPVLEDLAGTDSLPSVRASALSAASKLGTIEEVRPLLHHALKDDDWQLRLTAAKILGAEGSEEDIAVLKAAKRADVWWRGAFYRGALRAIHRRMRGL